MRGGPTRRRLAPQPACSRRRVAAVLARRGGESRAMSSRGRRGNRWRARFTVPQEPYCFYCNRRLLISGIKTDCFLLKGSLCTVILKVSNMKYRSRTIPYVQFHVHKNNLHDVLMVVPDLSGDGRRQSSGHDLADHRPGSGTAAETETTAPISPPPRMRTSSAVHSPLGLPAGAVSAAWRGARCGSLGARPLPDPTSSRRLAPSLSRHRAHGQSTVPSAFNHETCGQQPPGNRCSRAPS